MQKMFRIGITNAPIYLVNVYLYFLARTSSCQTFDSLDFARYSDDGDRAESDKVAGLSISLCNYMW